MKKKVSAKKNQNAKASNQTATQKSRVLATPKKNSPASKKTKKLAPKAITPKSVTAEIVDADEPLIDIASQDHEPENHFENEHHHTDDTGDDDESSDIKIDQLSHLPTTQERNSSSERGLASKDPLALYFEEIRKYPLLSREQELELAKKYYESKDPQIAQKLVTSNLRFVVKIAAEYSRFGARMIDLVQEGNLGLMHAVRDYNPYKGVKLITYAVWWIRGYIQEYLMKQFSLVKIGTTQNQKKLFYQLQRQKEELEALGKSPDIKLLSSTLGIPEDEVKMMTERMSGRDVSLDKTLDDDSTTSLMSLQKSQIEGPDEALAHREEVSQLAEVIEKLRPQLSDREKIILDERILNDEPLTLQEIGEKYGITREAVRQMEVRVMKKIKDAYTETNER